MSLASVAWPYWLVGSCKVSLTQSSWQSPAASREKTTVCQRLRLGCKHAIQSKHIQNLSGEALPTQCYQSGSNPPQQVYWYDAQYLSCWHMMRSPQHVWCLIGGFFDANTLRCSSKQINFVRAKLSHRIQDPLLRDFLYFSPSRLGPGARWQHQHHCPNAVETPQLGALSASLHCISQAPPLTFRICLCHILILSTTTVQYILEPRWKEASNEAAFAVFNALFHLPVLESVFFSESRCIWP